MCTYVHIDGRGALVRIAATRELGSYIRDRRRKLALTQHQLATNAGVSRRWLSDLEAGKETASAPLDRVAARAKACHAALTTR
jgi:transcriptional regulator with XRE-family HTH domain